MTILQALILGLVQGLTEFIPVSSTAHLILFPWVAGWTIDKDAAFAFNVLLQWGTLAAVVAYFRRDLARIAMAMGRGIRARRRGAEPEARLGWLLVLGTIPAAAFGFAFKGFFEELHESPVIVAGIMAGTAALLFASDALGTRRRGLDAVGAKDALLVGCSQALALLPGVSRSAATICGGLLSGLDRPAAARFSFLLSVPILAGAGIVAIDDLLSLPGYRSHLAPLLAGALAAAVVGYACIHWLLGYLGRHGMGIFAWYRIAAGLALVALAWRRSA